jgi:hypothetical protein
MKWRILAIVAALAALIGVAQAQYHPVGPPPVFYSPTTGSGTQTFTNSPCAGTTSEQWIPVKIYSGTGTNSTYYIPACQ